MGHDLLARTFLHLPGIGPRLERHLWRNGVQDWKTLRDEASQFLKGEKLTQILPALDASLEALAAGDLRYFATTLPSNEVWRLLDGRLHATAYFDIEASGGGFPPDAESTAICFYFRGTVFQEFTYEKKRALLESIHDEAAVICSYNGNGYDLPFLRQEFGGILSLIPHVDLCPWLRRLGLKGGLKAVQRALTHLHQRTGGDLDGWDAVRLWRFHERGVSGALETLLTYNAEDTIILEQLAVEAINREAAMRPELNLEALPQPALAPLPTCVSPAVLDLLQRPMQLEF